MTDKELHKQKALLRDIPDVGEFAPHKDNCNAAIGWLPINKSEDIFSELLEKKIHESDSPPERFVGR